MSTESTVSDRFESRTTNGRLFKSRLYRWMVILAIWTLPALLMASLIHARMVQLGEASSFWIWLLGKQLSWWVWALMTPSIVYLGRRFRIDRHWLSNGLIHIVFAGFYGFTHTALDALISMYVHGDLVSFDAYYTATIPHLIYRGPWAFLIYWAVLLVSYALEYQSRLRESQVNASRLEAQYAHARLEALQRQMQPHFLFNTLNSISVLVQKGETATAHSMISALSRLLRSTLSQADHQLVPLTKEIEFIRNYVAIEKIRFGDRLQVELQIAPEVENDSVPGFLLQTLVENAIRHGVTEAVTRSQVMVTAEPDNGYLQLRVRDNGPGLQTDVAGDSTNGIGIRNARERLDHLYGDDYRFDLRNADQGGAEALVRLPRQTLTASALEDS